MAVVQASRLRFLALEGVGPADQDGLNKPVYNI
jgi:hypothetical protein